MIETYTILIGKLSLDPNQFSELSQRTGRRGHGMKLIKRRLSHLSRLEFFANRVVTPQNELPQEAVSVESANTFKNRLDKYWAARKHDNEFLF